MNEIGYGAESHAVAALGGWRDIPTQATGARNGAAASDPPASPGVETGDGRLRAAEVIRLVR